MVKKLMQALTRRFRDMIGADLVNEMESALSTRYAERKAALLDQADLYEEQGRPSVAAELRQRAERLSVDTPLLSTDWTERPIGIESQVRPFDEEVA